VHLHGERRKTLPPSPLSPHVNGTTETTLLVSIVDTVASHLRRSHRRRHDTAVSYSRHPDCLSPGVATEGVRGQCERPPQSRAKGSTTTNQVPTIALPNKMPKIEGRPTYETVTLIKRVAYANAMATPTRQGQCGHLGVVAPPAECAALPAAPVPWVRPIHPGPHPGHGVDPAVAQVTEANRAHNTAVEEARLAAAVEDAIKGQALKAVESTHSSEIEDPLFMHGDNTVMGLLDHLDAVYGTATDDGLAEDKHKLGAPWDPDGPIETLWTRQTRRRAMSLTHDPVSWDWVIQAALLVIKKTGLFTLACDQWEERPAAQKTWDNMKTFFNMKDHLGRQRLTADGASY